MPRLPFDRRNPPQQPPAGCPAPLLWAKAYELHQEHRPNDQGICSTCVPAKFTPCQGRHQAMRGFLTSMGLDNLSLLARAPGRRQEDLPELVGAGGIAEMFHLSRQRIQQITHESTFPEPIAFLRAGRVWLKSDVDAWRRVYRPHYGTGEPPIARVHRGKYGTRRRPGRQV